jgi:very-short-patch-repair endonuclease
MSIDLDARFFSDLGERAYQRAYADEDPSEKVPNEITDGIRSISRAWMEGRRHCESPIEEIFLEKALFSNNGYTDVVWNEFPGAFDHEHSGFGACFEMQAEIGPYRVDFLFTTYSDGFKRKLVVECDGHDFHEKTKEQARRDKARDRYFAKHGISVIRFSGSEIYRDADECKEELETVLAGLTDECLFQAGRINGRGDR